MSISVRTAIAGFGMSGRFFHAPFINADKRFELKKIFERSGDFAKAEYPYVQTVRSFEELLDDDIDLVVISTPNPLHEIMAKTAMEAKKTCDS